jgi:hypothetical protein
MKTCPVCELALEDSYLFCPDDGSSLRAEATGAIDSRGASRQSAAGYPKNKDVFRERSVEPARRVPIGRASESQPSQR